MQNEIMTIGINTELLFQEAIKQGSSVDALERLMTMRRELKEEFSKESFFRSLSKFQSECPEVGKDKNVMEKDSSVVRYSYAPLDLIVKTAKPFLEANGFSHTFKSTQNNDSVTAICFLHHVDGYTQDTDFTVPIDPKAYMNAPQKVASALTYAKRYAFCNATGVQTGDTDTDANDLTEDMTNNQVIELEQLSQDMDQTGKDYIDKAIKKGMTKKQAESLILRAKDKAKK